MTFSRLGVIVHVGERGSRARSTQVYLHEEVDGGCNPASCHLCCLRPLTVFVVQVEPVLKQDKSTRAHVIPTCHCKIGS